MAFESDLEARLAPYLGGQRYSDCRKIYDREGYIVFENVLPDKQLGLIRDALAPWLDQNILGRNNFEGYGTNRVYALLAKSPVFADLVIHPLALAFAEDDLGKDCLLSACLAVNLHPGESVQPWHFDDGHCQLPRPRRAYQTSVFWAISETTEENGATELIPRSHVWGDTDKAPDERQTELDQYPDKVKLIMPAGSVAIAMGTLIHRGGANRSDRPRCIITPQYCSGFMRPLETMTLAVPPEIAAKLPERAQELLGYSIRDPFMGYVDGMHPKRLLAGS